MAGTRVLENRPELIYRRRKGSDTWHFTGLCSRWPTKDYEFYGPAPQGRLNIRPPKGELCNECKAKVRADRARVLGHQLRREKR